VKELFDTGISTKTENTHAGSGRICYECQYGQRRQCGSKAIWYCRTRSSNRTDNGLLKIKARQDACRVFEERK
jgi:hypothetical protein